MNNMSNYEYLMSITKEEFHAVLCGLMGIDLLDIAKEQAVMNWLNKEEIFTKPDEIDKLLKQMYQ